MHLAKIWVNFWNWCLDRNGWQALAGITYLIICIFDFVVVPTWIGINRIEVASIIKLKQLAAMDAAVQMHLIESLTYQHEPFTLKGGGLFHLAFGALLTGSALTPGKSG